MKPSAGGLKALPLNGPAPALSYPQRGSDHFAQAYAADIEAVKLHDNECT